MSNPFYDTYWGMKRRVMKRKNDGKLCVVYYYDDKDAFIKYDEINGPVNSIGLLEDFEETKILKSLYSNDENRSSS